MSFTEYQPNAVYTARIDAALGAKKSRTDFDNEAEWLLYEKTHKTTKLEYGHKYLTTFLRQDAAEIAQYENGEKPFLEQFNFGLAVANCQVEIPSTEALSELSESERKVYYIGLKKGWGLKKYPHHFPAMLKEAAHS